MIAFVLAVSTVAIALPCPVNSAAFPQENTKFFLCPSYREIDSADSDGQFAGYHKPTGRKDPLWLLEKEDEWIPFRALAGQEQRIPSEEERHQLKTFRCIFYYLAAFSHFMLDLFTPSIPVYYVYPYYRVAVPQDENILASILGAKSPAPSSGAEPAISSVGNR